ncbi:MAG TPA: polysaccharide deacetylase family protein [Candidatus Acidoferrum sp.]|nr:polysaccharide deacetylase family protein [Candidatus Acidoferrum sp.]
MRLVLLAWVGVVWPFVAMAQSPTSVAEKLGYGREAKLLIVHADDVGMTHAVNAATIKALESGAVNSASIMVACPWFPEIADYAKAHPDADFGLHLTLTSERVYYRWGPVAPRDKVASLVDENGYFWHDWTAGTRIQPKDAETELRAQIERAYAMGIRPTHLDSHQYRLIDNGKELFEVLLRIARERKLPFFVTRDWFAEHPYLESSLSPQDIVLDHTVTIDPSVRPEKWVEFYRTAVKNLQPGVTEFVIHVAFADEEMKAATRERETWGAAWRQRDFDFFTSADFRELLRQEQIHLITWRELARAR